MGSPPQDEARRLTTAATQERATRIIGIPRCRLPSGGTSFGRSGAGSATLPPQLCRLLLPRKSCPNPGGVHSATAVPDAGKSCASASPLSSRQRSRATGSGTRTGGTDPRTPTSVIVDTSTGKS